MKPVIETSEALLRQLVLEGDAQAFFSLTKAFLQERYLRLRSGETTRQEASRLVLAEAVELFEQVRHVSYHRLEPWLEEHCSLDSVSEEHAEALIDTTIIAEAEAFLTTCNRELVRSGSAMKRSALRADRKFPQVVLRNRAVAVLLPVAAVALLAAAVTFLMLRLHLTVELRFNSVNGSTVIVYPPSAWADASTTASPVPSNGKESVTAPAGSGADSLSRDSLPGDSLSQESSSGQPTGSPPPDTSQRRSLPPVRPKARLPRPPPPPPPPVEPPPPQVPSVSEEIVEPVEQPSPDPAPPPSAPLQEETETMY